MMKDNDQISNAPVSEPNNANNFYSVNVNMNVNLNLCMGNEKNINNNLDSVS